MAKTPSSIRSLMRWKALMPMAPASSSIMIGGFRWMTFSGSGSSSSSSPSSESSESLAERVLRRQLPPEGGELGGLDRIELALLLLEQGDGRQDLAGVGDALLGALLLGLPLLVEEIEHVLGLRLWARGQVPAPWGRSSSPRPSSWPSFSAWPRGDRAPRPWSRLPRRGDRPRAWPRHPPSQGCLPRPCLCCLLPCS